MLDESIEQGAGTVCSYTLSSRSARSIDALTVRQQLVSLQGDVVDTLDSVRRLSGEQTLSFLHSVGGDGDTLAVGRYACLLAVLVDGTPGRTRAG